MIDPCVDPAVYISIAEKHRWKIVSIIETHVHADHLSRALLLSGAVNAKHYLPAQDRVTFAYDAVADGQVIPLGRHAAFTALHTPCHTTESTCYLLDGVVLFTGDTLFLRGVGRPDLEGGRHRAAELGRALHRSLARLRTLPASVMVLPGHTHTPVAFDGVPLGAPLHQVFAGNPLVGLPEREFVHSLLARIPETPPNFLAIRQLNESGERDRKTPSSWKPGPNRCAVI